MKPISILIVDDVPYVRQLVANELMALDGAKDVYEADNSATAITAMMEHCPDLMILDINIPSATIDGVRYASGIDVLRSAKKHLADSTVIMLTNSSDEYYRRECTKAGADFFFDKTNEFDAFLAQVQKVLKNTSW